jgi:dTDP-4-dehydrorhamnose reductase
MAFHYSTDYVFDGTKTSSYNEDDKPAPLNAYGRSKLAGDLAIAASTPDHTILRVSWVYGAIGRNFAKAILKRACENDELRVVADQFGAPTSAGLVADVTLQIIRRHLDFSKCSPNTPPRGVFNVAPSGRASWHQYAVELIREAKRQNWPLKAEEENIIPIRTDQYPTLARRPKNSLLDTTKVRRIIPYDLPSWESNLRKFVGELRDIVTMY